MSSRRPVTFNGDWGLPIWVNSSMSIRTGCSEAFAGVVEATSDDLFSRGLERPGRAGDKPVDTRVEAVDTPVDSVDAGSGCARTEVVSSVSMASDIRIRAIILMLRNVRESTRCVTWCP